MHRHIISPLVWQNLLFSGYNYHLYHFYGNVKEEFIWFFYITEWNNFGVPSKFTNWHLLDFLFCVNSKFKMVRSFTRLEYQKCLQQEIKVAAGSLGPDLQTNAQVYRRDVWKTATMSTTCRSRRSSPSVTGVEQDLLKQQVDGKCQQSRKSIHHGAVESLSPAGWNHRKCKEPSCCKVNFLCRKFFFYMKMFPKLKMVPKRRSSWKMC